MTNEQIPAAEVIAVRDRHGLRAVRVLCCYCGQTHLHPCQVGDVGPHEAHCARGQYLISTPTTTEGNHP